jgi:hypothetical protein
MAKLRTRLEQPKIPVKPSVVAGLRTRLEWRNRMPHGAGPVAVSTWSQSMHANYRVGRLEAGTEPRHYELEQ